MKNTFTSIVVLSYNRKDYLQKSLESLWANTTSPYELIIVDDGSDKETQDYVYKLVENKRISSAIFNCGKNMGIGTGINRGFNLAQGRYLVKADADILYKPRWLEEMLSIISYKKAGCVGGFKYYHDPVQFDKMLLEEKKYAYKVKDFVSSVFLTTRYLYNKMGIESFSDAFAEDVGFKTKLRKRGYDLYLTKEDLLENFGFGLERSTLFTPESTPEKIEVIKIAKEPLIFNT